MVLQDTETFCRQTLCNSDVAHYINHTFVSWGGDVRHPDAYKLSNRCTHSAAGRLSVLLVRLHIGSFLALHHCTCMCSGSRYWCLLWNVCMQ